MKKGEEPVAFQDRRWRRGRWVRLAAWRLAALLGCTLLIASGAVVWASDRVPLRLPGARSGTDAQAAARAADGTQRQLVQAHVERFAFYMPWDARSRDSLQAQAAGLDWVVPGLASVAGPDHRFRYARDAFLHQVLDGAPPAPRLLVMVQNASGDGHWDGAGTRALLRDPAARATFLAQVSDMVAAEGAQGVTFDLENLPADAHADYRSFLSQARRQFAPRGWLVTIAAPLADPDWDLAAYAQRCDRIFLMAYDEHWAGGEAGPIASQPWFAAHVAQAVASVGPARSIVAIGNYAYDWHGGQTDILTVRDAWARARDAGTAPQIDSASENATFFYQQDGVAHRVWLLDAASAGNELRAIAQTGAAGVALWRLGSEDPAVWNAWKTPASVTPERDGIGRAPGGASTATAKPPFAAAG